MKNILKKTIFGKRFLFLFKENVFSKIIERELSVYSEQSFAERDSDYVVEIDSDNKPYDCFSYGRNPKEVFVSEDILCITYFWGIVSWKLDGGEKRIRMSFNKDVYSSQFEKRFRKFMDIQNYSQEEWAGLRLYETVLINTVFWEKEYFLLHGSGVCDKKGNVVIIGGTGGTGKTSTVLSMRNREDRVFVCDDLCPIKNDGTVYVNYDKPKIYAYNLINNPVFERSMIQKENFLSRLQWRIKKSKSPSSVRRRVSPNELYTMASEDLIDKLKLHSYLILNRTMDVDEITIRTINNQVAAAMTTEIMRVECNEFATYLNYYKLNGLYKGNSNYCDAEDCFNIWKTNMLGVFANIDIRMISIPFDYDNEKLKEEMNKIIDTILV